MNDTINDLGYLLHHLSTSLDRQSDLFLQDRLDIGFSQFKILMALQQKQGVQQKEIAAKLGQTEASVSRQIRMLEDVGFIKTSPGPRDKRQKVTQLTAKGERVISRAIIALNNFHSPTFDSLSVNEKEQFQSILKKLHFAAISGGRTFELKP